MSEKRTVTFDDSQEAIQYLVDRLERAELRLRGMFVVLNAWANDVRNTDPGKAKRIVDLMSSHVVKADLHEQEKEVVEAILQLLQHGQAPDLGGLQ